MANAMVAVTIKGAERHGCRPSEFGTIAMATAGIISLFVAWLQPGSWSDYRLWLLGIILGILYYVAVISMLRANCLSPPSLPLAMANLALVVPIALAGLFLDEKLRFLDGITMLAFLGMLTAFIRGTSIAGDTTSGYHPMLILMLALVFFSNGLVMFGFKLNSLLPADVNVLALSAIMYGAGSLLAWLNGQRRPDHRYRRQEAFWGVCMGIGGGTAIPLFLLAMRLPAMVAFPTMQGISFLGGIGVTALVYREKLNLWKCAGMAMGIAVILLSAWR